MSRLDDHLDLAADAAKLVGAAAAGIATAAAPTGLYAAAVSLGIVSAPITLTVATAVGGIAATVVAGRAGYRLFNRLRQSNTSSGND